MLTVSHVLIPASNAALIIGKAWASGSVNPIAPVGLPKDMVPRIILETFRPDFPSLAKEEALALLFTIRATHTERIPFRMRMVSLVINEFFL
jgi:hypothetical protein